MSTNIDSTRTGNTSSVNQDYRTASTSKPESSYEVALFEYNKEAHNSDEVKFQNKPASTKQKVDAYYSQIEKSCRNVGFSVEVMRKYHLLERVAGVNTEEELANLSENKINAVISAINSEFSLLSSPRTYLGKFFTRSNDTPDEKLIEQLVNKARNELISQKEGINDVEKFLFKLFNKEVSKIIEEYLPKDKEPTQEEYIEAARKLLSKDLEKINELTDDAAKEKAYDDLYKKYTLYLTTKMNKDDKRALAVIAAAVGELEANDRKTAIKNYIESGSSDKADRALIAQQFAEHNIMTTDQLGNKMSAEDSAEYQHTTFANMNDEGIQESLYALNKRADELKSKYQELLEKKKEGKLSEEEAKELELLERYIIPGYSGSITGIAVNSNITTESAYQYMAQINQDTIRHGIEDEVAETAAAYMNSHPEINENNNNRDITDLINKATSNKYSKILTQERDTDVSANVSKVQVAEENKSDGRTAEYKTKTKTEAEAEKEIPQKQHVTDNTSERTVHNNLTNPLKTPSKTSTKDNDSVEITNKNKNTKINKNNSQTAEQKEAISYTGNKNTDFQNSLSHGVKALQAYADYCHMSNQQLSVEILNSNNAGRNETEYAIEIFKLCTDTTKENIFNAINNDDSKLEISKYMKTEQIEKVIDPAYAYLSKNLSKIVEQRNKNIT